MKNEELPPPDDAAPPAAPADPQRAPQAEAGEESPAAKARFVFKIVPANPRNALDFEDVADK